MDEQDRTEPSYEGDVYGWSLRHVELLRAGRYDDFDVDHVIEEIEGVARSQATSLKSSYRLIAAHLQKILVQPEHFTRSWQGTIITERFNALGYLEESQRFRAEPA